jgi:hypothetical protein
VGYAVAGALVGAIMGGIGAAVDGGNFGDVLRGMAMGAVEGALSGPLHLTGGLVNIVGHGIVGGLCNEAMGGRFQDGFLSAAASAATAESGLTDPDSKIGIDLKLVGRTAVAAIAGGTASAIGGGKFANGAVTAAMHHLVNAEGGAERAKEFFKDFGAEAKYWGAYAWDEISQEANRCWNDVSNGALGPNPEMFFAGCGKGLSYLSNAARVGNAAENTAVLSNQSLRGISSLEKQIVAHEAKLAEFIKNPTVRPGMEGQSQAVIKAAQEARIRHLQREIDAFKGNIEKLKNGGR